MTALLTILAAAAAAAVAASFLIRRRHAAGKQAAEVFTVRIPDSGQETSKEVLRIDADGNGSRVDVVSGKGFTAEVNGCAGRRKRNA